MKGKSGLNTDTFYFQTFDSLRGDSDEDQMSRPEVTEAAKPTVHH